MNCPKCGTQNMDGVTFCGSCGAQIASLNPPSPVEHQQSADYSQQQPYQQPPTQQQPPNSGWQPAVSPSGGYAANVVSAPPKNYMTEAIIVTVVSFLCCSSLISLILGIIAIVKANNVNTEFAKGNIDEANKNADAAKKLTLWAAIIAVVFIIFVFILIFAILGVGISGLGGLDEILKNM